MKQLLPLLAFAASATIASATVHTVTCQNGPDHFLPVTVYANVGDTIHWTWISGTHVVGVINETDIPALADSWYASITASFTDFEYVLAQPGYYHYVCHPLNPHDEDGYIEVALNTAVQEPGPASAATLYPNPFTDQITVEVSGANSVRIHNLLGEVVAACTLATGRTQLRTPLATLPKGVYLFSILRNGVVLETRRVVKE